MSVREIALPGNACAIALVFMTVCEAQDVRINKRMAEYGATIVPDGANILHHCNTGALATVDIGTAIGVIYGT